MKLEHFALNVAEPQKLMDWWCANLGFTQTHPAFIVDETGKVAIEIYRNDSAAIPDYSKTAPFTLHVAFLSDDVEADRQRLEKAGATTLEVVHKEDFDMVMMRDPFGIPIQFVKRAKSILL